MPMAKGANIQLLLVRSGQTDWDAAGRLQGETDLPLSDQGRVDLQSALLRLGGRSLGVVLCGTDEASLETARLVADRTGARLRQIKALSEVDLGLWEGLLESELTERYRKSYAQWRDDPTAVTAPEGEPVREAEQRIYTALARAMEKADRRTLAVVLRPLAFAMVRRWLEERSREDLFPMMARSGGIQEYVIPRTRLETLSQELKAGA